MSPGASGGENCDAIEAYEAETAGGGSPRRLSWQQTPDGGWAAKDALGPKAKQVLEEAMVESVLDDGTVKATEAEMLRAACG